MKKTKIKKTKIKDTVITITKDYATVLFEIRNHIEQCQFEAITAINIVLNTRNWFIGKIITEKQNEHKWGSNFLDTLAKDLQNMYPGNSGFSPANVYRMKAFYDAYENFRTAVRKLEELPIFAIPWGHNVIILQKIKNSKQRLWYAQKSLELGWSRSTLEKQIKYKLYQREGKAISNFKYTLPSPDSGMAQEAFKDPYIFDFLKLQDDHLEYELEQGLIDDVQKMLLELGKGFALVGRQYHVQVGNKDYYIDLLFYHYKLKCFIVVELKSSEFMPEHAGKVNFYLSAVDSLVRSPEDKPTIGLILCKIKDNYTAEYALRNITSPIGVAEYETEIIKKLPKEFKGKLPTIEEIEAELEKGDFLEEKIMSKTKKRPLKKNIKTTKKLNKKGLK
jgi:predicted nuclease of restriction endonuclease-like (RecB) superfamily